MPWKETCAVDQRVALLADWLRDEWTMTELAARYAISRKTAYKWVDRYEAEGAAGLEERSRAPTHPGRAIARGGRGPRSWRCGGAHPHWGPRKLAVLLRERDAATAVAGAEHDGGAVAPGGAESRCAVGSGTSCR